MISDTDRGISGKFQVSHGEQEIGILVAPAACFGARGAFGGRGSHDGCPGVCEAAAMAALALSPVMKTSPDDLAHPRVLSRKNKTPTDPPCSPTRAGWSLG